MSHASGCHRCLHPSVGPEQGGSLSVTEVFLFIDSQSVVSSSLTMTTHQSLVEQIQMLQDERPQVYTVLSTYYEEVHTAISACSRAYPTSRQLYEQLDDPEIHPKMLALALGFLAEVGVIDTYTVRSGANRYDFREYNADRFDRIGDLINE